MSRREKLTVEYICDSCRVVRSKYAIWFGFPKGKNTPSHLSSELIFCSELCGNEWISKQNSWLKELNRNDMDERFPSSDFA